MQRLRGEETRATTSLVLVGGLYRSLCNMPNVLMHSLRRCPGAHLAVSSNWLAIASIIATMDITKAVDEKGKTIEPEYVFENPIFRSVLMIRCNVTHYKAFVALLERRIHSYLT